MSRQSHVDTIRGVHILALMGIVLAAMAVRATEVYTTRYQSLPVLDWLESQPPLSESADLPAASDLARGLSRALPLLVISSDVRPILPVFGPPAVFQRTMGGVRDASHIELGSPGSFQTDQTPVQARLDVIRGVFQKFPMIPALKAAIAHHGGDAGWSTVRPPLVALTPAQANALVAELDRQQFVMPGLAAR